MDAAEPTYLLQGEKDWRLGIQVGMESKTGQGEGRWEVMGECNQVQAILVSTGRKEDEGVAVLGKS